jgi:hypothetical protein
MELAGADILESLGIVLSGDPSIPVRCMITDFIISDGVLKTKLFLMDTTDTNLVATAASTCATRRSISASPPIPRTSACSAHGPPSSSGGL